MARVLFARKVSFTASHHYQLASVSNEENQRMFGEASQIHEHVWSLTIWLEGPVDPVTGMMVDLLAVDEVLQTQVVEPFHLQHFNQVDSFFKQHQPTTEVLAAYFAQRLIPHFQQATLVRLKIAECDDLFAEWWA